MSRIAACSESGTKSQQWFCFLRITCRHIVFTTFRPINPHWCKIVLGSAYKRPGFTMQKEQNIRNFLQEVDEQEPPQWDLRGSLQTTAEHAQSRQGVIGHLNKRSTLKLHATKTYPATALQSVLNLKISLLQWQKCCLLLRCCS